MASTQDQPTQNQLTLARTALWHQDGNALRTLDDLRDWLDAAGLVAYTPHAQFAAAPQPSFAEAVLGRPENNWIPKAAASGSPSEEESYAVEVEDEEPEEDVDEEDDNEPADAVEFADENSSDDEVMLSNDDEAAEDEGDEIAEEDTIDAAAEPEETVTPINGFTADERETVRHMLARLVEDGSAVPLNLLGNSLGEPDFVCSAQAFSFVYTLRGDKNFKNEPATTGSMRVSPLAAKVYDVLKEKGALAPHELTAELGQGVVDSAVLRALSELWAILRVVPIPEANGEPSKWELTSGRYLRHIKAGANAGQPTALSALLSLYLSQAVAATSDEMEIFLSPLAARSRVREVVGGLSATNQLDDIILDGKTAHYLPGALSDLPEDTAEAKPFVQQRSRYEDDDRRAMIEARNARFAAEGGAPAGERRPFREGGFKPREGSYGQRREGGFGGPRREGGFGQRREGGFTPQRRSGGFSGGNREGFAGRSDRERRPFTRNTAEGAATDRPRNEFARTWDDDRKSASEGAERRPFTPRDGGNRPFAPRGDRPSYGDRKPFAPRGDRPSYGDRESRGDRPFTPRGDRPYFGDRKPFGGDRANRGGDRPFTPRGDRPTYGDRKPFTPREGGDRPFNRGDRPSYGNREGSDRRPFAPRGDRPFTSRGDRSSYGDRKPFAPREGGDRPFIPRGDRPSYGGDRKPFAPRGDRKPFGDREGGDRRPFEPRGDRPFTPRGDRPSYGGDRKPFAPRVDRKPFGDRDGGDRRPFTPRGDRPFTSRGDRPSYGDRKPFAPREGGDRPFTPRGDRPSYGGGDRKPFAPRGDRPFTPRGDRPSYGGGDRKPFTPREGGDRPKFGGGGFGRDRKGPSGFSKPGFKPSFRGPGSGPARGGAPKRRPE